MLLRQYIIVYVLSTTSLFAAATDKPIEPITMQQNPLIVVASFMRRTSDGKTYGIDEATVAIQHELASLNPATVTLAREYHNTINSKFLMRKTAEKIELARNNGLGNIGERILLLFAFLNNYEILQKKITLKAIPNIEVSAEEQPVLSEDQRLAQEASGVSNMLGINRLYQLDPQAFDAMYHEELSTAMRYVIPSQLAALPAEDIAEAGNALRTMLDHATNAGATSRVPQSTCLLL